MTADDSHARKIVEVYRQAIADSAHARAIGEVTDQSLFEDVVVALAKAYPFEINSTGEPVQRMPLPTATTLLPCPFCGGDPEFARVGTLRRTCIISCRQCSARLETAEVAASGQRWNQRVNLHKKKPGRSRRRAKG